jgi:hypothetical protein
LAVRASKKLRSDELLVTGFGATRLRMELDRVPLWRGDIAARSCTVMAQSACGQGWMDTDQTAQHIKMARP